MLCGVRLILVIFLNLIFQELILVIPVNELEFYFFPNIVYNSVGLAGELVS